MSIFQADAGAVKNYILREQEGTDNPITWKLKVLTSRELAKVMEKVKESVDQETFRIPAEAAYQAYSLGVVGWEDAVDEEGAEIAFSPAQKEKVAFPVMLELGMEVVNRSQLTALEKKI